MRGLSFAVILVLAAFHAPVQAAEPDSPEQQAPSCHTGSYRMADGSALDIGPGAAGGLRWRRTDGRTGALARQADGVWISTLGWTDRRDGHRMMVTDCDRGEIRFDDVPGKRQSLVQVSTRFEVSGATLSGRLTLPPGEARVPVVVLIHGAERSSAVDTYSLQRELASQGIGVFAYDKRGTGHSDGRYTQNYLILATDAIHAMREARRLAGKRAGRIGYQGGSQGGWVAPLAASIEPVDFVIVSFGLAVSPIEEDREAIAFDMARASFGPEVQRKASEVADATAAIIGSNFTEGFDRLDALKEKYGKEPWFPFVRGNFTSYLLSTPEAAARRDFPALLEGVPALYDPMPVLSNLDVPQLWILGGQDRDAPPFETLRRLDGLKRAGRPITTAVFPEADHGMYEFETDAHGERVSTRQPEGYLHMMVDFIKQGDGDGASD
ncbi:alpha/beta hydrolase [Pseudoxanthomonas daejeonensis]|uniref:alpha/beta hydrolase family protein n=1 Tax=Pseudoxanthomonas daejeonensis TaxID=266062 RepID=UPI001F53EFB0|nr:alpha/beta fold hydrolase [Pseudoxanthomonas daejeonensis]UNK58617.1 alpha/beta hydrolase [Pseudoxanthomonas daejeonensis]